MPQSEAWSIRQKIIGVLLRQARQDAGKSLKECGQVLSVSSSTISAIEHGKRHVSLPELEMLAYYLQVPLDYLLDPEAAPDSPEPQEVPGAETLLLRQRIIGTLLRQARLKLDLNQAKLAKQVGLSQRHLSQYEQGTSPIPVVELEALSQALGVPLSYFLDQEVGRIGEQQRREREWRQFAELPADVRAFVLKPVNINYIEMAMRLSDVSVDGLRNIAASLLEITL